MKVAEPTIHRKKWWKVQWKPNLIRPERRLVLTRIFWNTGEWKANGSTFCSHKLSVSLCWSWRSLYVGLTVKPELWGWLAWLCIVPCLPIRFHLKRSYGGSMI